MLEKITGIVVLTGLILSVVGSVMENENIKITGILILLITATIAGYRFLKFSITTPTTEFIGICIEKKRFSTHYILSFRTGEEGLYSGRTSLQLGDKIKLGERARVKIKGPIVLEINKI